MTAGWKRRAALATAIAAQRSDGSVPEDAVRRAAATSGPEPTPTSWSPSAATSMDG
jgi:hypothetical protein